MRFAQRCVRARVMADELPSVEFTPEALLDFQEAYDWYEAQRTGLGAQFALSIEAAIEQARRHPHSGLAIHGEVRRVLARRFPYGVLYVPVEGRLVVVAIFHGQRKPTSWKERL